MHRGEKGLLPIWVRRIGEEVLGSRPDGAAARRAGRSPRPPRPPPRPTTRTRRTRDFCTRSRVPRRARARRPARPARRGGRAEAGDVVRDATGHGCSRKHVDDGGSDGGGSLHGGSLREGGYRADGACGASSANAPRSFPEVAFREAAIRLRSKRYCNLWQGLVMCECTALVGCGFDQILRCVPGTSEGPIQLSFLKIQRRISFTSITSAVWPCSDVSCEEYPTCAQCMADSLCGWCAATGVCR